MALDCGHKIIVDTVCITPQTFQRWKDSLSKHSVIYVGLMASDASLAKREKQRGDRIAGSSRAQNATVHKNNTYDLVLDTDALSPEDGAQHILNFFREQS